MTDDWMSDNETVPGVHTYVTLPNGTKVMPSYYVSDIARRSLLERLLSFPWRPLKKYKEIRRGYKVRGVMIVSHKTFNIIKEQLNGEL